MMITLEHLIQNALEKAPEGNAAKQRNAAIIFLLNNEAFGSPIRTDELGLPCIDEAYVPEVMAKLETFLAHMGEEKEEKMGFLWKQLEEKVPLTAHRLQKFLGIRNRGNELKLLDYLAAFLDKEVHEMDDRMLEGFIEQMARLTILETAKMFSEFAGWMRLVYKDTIYTADILVKPRSTRSSTDAYGIETYARLMYYFFNEDHCVQCGMYQKACEDVKYAHSVTYMSTHLISSIRDSDLPEMPHPSLPYGAQETLDKVRAGELTDEEAARGAEEFTGYLRCWHPTPHKNLERQNIPDLVFRIPQSLEVHFGKLFLICQAHILLGNVEGDNPPLFKRVSDYKSLQRLFGDDVAEMFLERDFCPTAMSKTFLQAVSIMASQSGQELGTHTAITLALSIAGMARSHKGSVLSFSETTIQYLKDGALGLLTPELVTREMFERGILSCVTSEFLSLLTDEKYKKLDFVQQTALFKELGLSPLEIEKAMEAFLLERKRARTLFQRILSITDGEEQRRVILGTMQNIADGLAPGKDNGAHCLVAAMGHPCAVPDSYSCLSCPYRVDTRATLYHAIAELKRLRRLQRDSVTPGSKKKYQLIVEKYLMPSIVRTIMAAQTVYGEEAGQAVRRIVTRALEEEEDQ